MLGQLPTLLPTASHLTLPQPPGSLQRGASGMNSGRSGLGRVKLGIRVLGAPGRLLG